MTETQESKAAHDVIGFVHRMISDHDGVLIDDYHATTTAIIWHALELQLGGPEKVSVLINQRSE